MGKIKKTWEKFQDLTVARKLLALSLVVSIGPILCILLINYQLSAAVMRNQTGELIQANLEQNAVNIENFCKSCEKIVQGIYTDEFYTEKLKPINRWDYNERYKAEYEIEERLRELCYNNSGVLGIAIVGLHYDVCFYDTVSQSGQDSFCFDFEKLRKERLLAQVKQNRGVLYTSSESIYQGEYGSYNCMYVIHQLTDFSEYQKGPVGCILLCYDETELEELYSPGNTESNRTFLADSQGNLISSSEENWRPRALLDRASQEALPEKGLDEKRVRDLVLEYAREEGLLKGGSLEARSVGILDGQFYVVNVQSFSHAMQDFTHISMMIALVGVLAMLLCIIFTLNISEAVDKSVKPIIQAMDKANAGEEEKLIEEKDVRGEEFAKISRHFNRMIQNIQYARALEMEALIREKNAEIKALEAQINPHFLYNTLDAINWLAIDRNEYTISRMLTSLAAILRYSIHKSNEIAEIGNELLYLKKYVHLQQQRLNYSFLCTMKVDEELYPVKIHKMLLQPLLENTLVHGFPGKSEIDEIKLSIRRTETGKLKIVVEDNGVGMSQEMVELFNQYDYTRDRIEGSIGLRNVIARLKLYYGEASSFFIESGENGTKISMEIPCGDLEEKNENHTGGR